MTDKRTRVGAVGGLVGIRDPGGATDELLENPQRYSSGSCRPDGM